MGERPPQRIEWAAGGVVRRTGADEYLVVHRPRYDDWTLPKGKVEAGELLVEAALREVAEETGVAAVVDRAIGTVSYDAGRVRKVVRWWTMAGDGEFTPNGEVDERRWLPHAAARELLSYEADRNVLDRAHALETRPGSGRVFLVRHATAGSRDHWRADDRARPLDPGGLRQALSLRASLSSHPITGVWSSPYVRCVETVAPLAKLLGLRVSTTAMLAEPVDLEAAIGWVCSRGEGSWLLCSHGNVVAAIVGRLAAEGVPIDGELRWEKGSTWVIDLDADGPTGAAYLPPPS